MTKFKIIILLFLSHIILFAQKTYYVSNNGNNTKSGLNEENAWKTIEKVNSMMSSYNPGDQILFRNGDVFSDSRLIITSNGSVNNFIKFSSYGTGASPVIGDKSSKEIETISIMGEYIIISDLIIYGTSSKVQKECNGIGLYNNNFVIENCYLEGGNPGSKNLTNLVHTNMGIAIANKVPLFNGIIRKNTIAYWYRGIAFGKVKNILIDDNVLYQFHKGNQGHQNASDGSGGSAIHFFGLNDDGTSWDMEYTVKISNNNIYEFERWGIAMSSVSNCIVEKNEFHHNLDERIYHGGVSHGNAIKLTDRRAGPVLGDGSIGNIFRYNIIHDLGRHQVSGTYNSDFGKPYTINHYNSVIGGSGIDFQIHNNLAYNCGGGFAETADSYIDGESISSSNYWVEIYYNTCYNVSHDVLSPATIYIDTDNSKNGVKVKIFNNIIFDGYVDNDQPIIRSMRDLLEGNNLILNNVEYIHNSNSPPSNGFFIWEQYKSHSVQGELSVLNGNAGFEDIANFNFSVTKLSQAINIGRLVGVDQSGRNIDQYDLWGNERKHQTIGSIAYLDSIEENNVGLFILLEGAFEKNTVTTVLSKNNLLPNTQPYFEPPWNLIDNINKTYNGNDIVDWIIVELRSNENTILKSKAALLKKDGTVLNPNGKNLSFDNLETGKYFIVIRHRNHLDVMSANKVDVVSSQTISYNFTDSQSKAFGNKAMVQLPNGSFAMYSGDADNNNIINNLDFGTVANSIPKQGYHNSDLDMNGVVNVLDYNKINKNILKSSQVPN